MQSVTPAIQRDLEAMENARPWPVLRQRAELEGRNWASTVLQCIGLSARSRILYRALIRPDFCRDGR
ncbi:hypothetical protein BJQ89_01781 [Arthrobacter sp. ES1]|nr:hypothetical protein [Arthrobacter sp. ES1]